MTAVQQKIQSLLDSLTEDLRQGDIYRLVFGGNLEKDPKVPLVEKPIAKQEIEPEDTQPVKKNAISDYPLQAVTIQHKKDADFVQGIYIPKELEDSLTPALKTARYSVCSDFPNLESSADLAEFFRIPEDMEEFYEHGTKLLADEYIKYGSTQLDISVDEFLQATHGNCIIQLTDGSITSRHAKDISGSKDIAAILAFPSDMTSYCSYVARYTPVDDLKNCGHIHTMVVWGVFSDLPNLVYITSIPEGVRDLQLAFQGCPKLNCPIHIPSTATRLFGMLNECDSFNSEVIIHSEQKDIPGLSSMSAKVVWNS